MVGAKAKMNILVATPSQRAELHLNLLSDKNPNVRKKAAESLGKIGDKAWLLRLKAALRTEADAAARKAIKDAIAGIEA